MTDEQFAELLDYLRGMPDHTRALVRDWPPGCKVMAADHVNVFIPAEGIVGKVNGYSEDGLLTVVAPAPWDRDTAAGETIKAGTPIGARLKPGDLVYLEDGDVVTRADVDRALAELK